MQIGKNVIRATMAGAVLLVSAGGVFAAQATATTNVNVRSGPGGGYGVVDSLRRGDRVEVQECQAGWCYVQKRGPDGWVSSSYLSLRGNNQGGGRGNGYNVSPGVTLEFNFGNVPAPRPQPPRPPRPDYGGWNGGNGGGWNGGQHGGGWDNDWDRDNGWDNGPRGPRDWN